MIEWIKTSERLPEKTGKYLYSGGKDWCQIEYDAERNDWLGDPDQHGYHSYISPKYWAEVQTPREQADAALVERVRELNATLGS